MRCLILDDEALARQELRRLLAAHPDVSVAGDAASVAQALDLVARLCPDVVFIDVKLRGETGFDFVGQMPEPLPHLVFVTAYDQYATRGFECNALDYLLKPVHPDRLAETIRRIRLRQPLHHPAGENDAVFLKIGSTARFVSWREIHHIEAKGNYTRLYFENGSTVLLVRSLKQWAVLAPAALFLQVHRTVLVRRDAIRQLDSTVQGGRKVILSNDVELPVGRAYWPRVKAFIEG